MAEARDLLWQYLGEKNYPELVETAKGLAPDGIDIREGSIYYDAVAPLCYELATAYEDLETLLTQTYASMADYPYLDIRCAERNIYRLNATKAQLRVFFSKHLGDKIIPATDIRVRSEHLSGLLISTTNENPNWTYEIISKYSIPTAIPASITKSFTDGAFLKSTATTKYTGTAGNNISLEIVAKETGSGYLLKIYYNNKLMISQELEATLTFDQIKATEYLEFAGQGTIREVAKLSLTGGKDKGTVEDGYYVAECNEAGVKGGTYVGQLLPVENIGEATCENKGVIVYGEDAETDEQLRERYFKFLNKEAFGGNMEHYKRWLTDSSYGAPSGISEVQVYPVWAGGGTVKVSIINNQFKPVSEGFIKQVKEFLDPVGETGKGIGIAPIGHLVTVTTPNEVEVMFKIPIKIDIPEELESFRALITEELDKYFQEVKTTWDKLNREKNLYDSNIIIHSIIVSRISAIDGIKGVKDIDLKMSKDGGKTWINQDLTLQEDSKLQEIASVGTIELSTY